MFNTMTINRHKPLQSPDHVQFANGSQGGMKHVCRCLCSGIVVGFQQPTEATEVCCGETPRFSPGKTYGKYGASACGLIWNHLDWDYGKGYYSIGKYFFSECPSSSPRPTLGDTSSPNQRCFTSTWTVLQGRTQFQR